MESNNSIKFSFLQISDLRLGSTASLSLHLSPSQRQQRQEESLAALQKAVDFAKERALDAILIPGNLYDQANVTAKTISAIQRILAAASPLPIYICPGAIDPLSRDSFYLPDVLSSRGLDDWTANVYIFRGPGLQTTSLQEKSNVRISALATHVENADTGTAANLPPLEEHDRGALNVLLIPLPLNYIDKSLSDEEFSQIIGQPDFSYSAVSGLLNQCRCRSEEGRVVAAATGTFSAQTAHEIGARIGLSADLTRKLPGRLELELEPIEFDQRRIINLNMDLSTIVPEQWTRQLESNLIACGIREEDILLFDLSGAYPAGQEQNLVQQVREKTFFHMRCGDTSRPDYLANLSSENKVEQSLIEHLNAMFAEANRKTDESESRKDDDELAIIDDALYFGLEALREGKVTLRNAD